MAEASAALGPAIERVDRLYWVPSSSALRTQVRAALTLRQRAIGRVYTFAREPLESVEVAEEGEALGVPRAWALTSRGAQILASLEAVRPAEDARCDGWGPVDLRVRFNPRSPAQADAVRNVVRRLSEPGPHGGVIEALPGQGKTLMGLAIAGALKCATLVLVHSMALVDQWVARIREHTDLPEDAIGIVRGKRHDGPGKAICVGLVQSVAKDKYGEEWKRVFGTVIYDETDLFPTACFGVALRMFPARYRLGLTATLERKDGLSRLLDWHVGPVVARLMTPDVIPEVHAVQHDEVYRGRRFQFVVDGEKRTSYARMMQALERSELRNRLILRLATKAMAAGRTTLVLSHHREHVTSLRARFEAANGLAPGCATGLFLGGESREAIEVAKTKPTIFGCVTEDTECLTLGGWKTYRQLNIGELVAAYNLTTERVEYVPLEAISVYEYSGDMYLLDRAHGRLLMTPDHRVVAMTRTATKSMRRVDELIAQHRIVIRAPFDYPEMASLGGEGIAELVGWFIAEGTFKEGSGVNARLNQNVGKHADRIDHLLNVVGIPHTRKEYVPGHLTWRFGKDTADQTFRRWCPEKRLNARLVSLPHQEAAALFDGLIDGDGHRRPDGNVIFVQKDTRTIDWFTILALRLGWQPLVRGQLDGTDCQVVRLSRRETVGLWDHRCHLVRESYTGLVWCPQTAHGTWIARRAGSVCITGNSFKYLGRGVDLPAADALILALPVADVRQVVGRVLRDVPGKKTPIVCDVVDTSVDVLRGMWEARKRWYREINATGNWRELA